MKNEKCVKDESRSEFTKEEQEEFLNLLGRITPEQREALKKFWSPLLNEEGCRVTQWPLGILLFVNVHAPNGYYQPGNTYDDLNPVLIKLGYTNSLGVYVEENFAYLLAPDCSYADLEELSNLANEAIGAQMKYPNDVNNMYRNTYNAYPLSKVWNFYTRSWS